MPPRLLLKFKFQLPFIFFFSQISLYSSNSPISFLHSIKLHTNIPNSQYIYILGREMTFQAKEAMITTFKRPAIITLTDIILSIKRKNIRYNLFSVSNLN